VQCQLQELLRRQQIPVGRQHEINRVPVRIDGAIEVHPVSRNANVSLVDPPGPNDVLEMALSEQRWSILAHGFNLTKSVCAAIATDPEDLVRFATNRTGFVQMSDS
jgi:hypothetical protein